MRLTSRTSLVIALVFGTLAAFLVRGLIQGMAGDGASAGRTIVVARAPIAYGLPLGPDNLREIPWRAADAPEGSFARVADLLKDGRRLALATLQRGEPVLGAKITGPGQRASLSTQLDDGMRAVTVRVDEVRGVAGFVLPGDRVDVILTRGETSGQDANAFADVLLQNTKVLAVDQIAEGQEKPTVARAVTLELGAQQAQKVVLAQGIGRLSLVLRQANAADDGASARVTVGDLGAGEGAQRDRLAELDRRLDEMRKAADEARGEAERRAAQRLAEPRMRAPAAPVMPVAPPPVARMSPPNSVVNVIRNGSKTEQYTVLNER